MVPTKRWLSMVAWQKFPIVAVLCILSLWPGSMVAVWSPTEEAEDGSAWDELHVGCGILHCEMSKSGSWSPLVKSR
jgi:hypothetical protein